MKRPLMLRDKIPCHITILLHSSRAPFSNGCQFSQYGYGWGGEDFPELVYESKNEGTFSHFFL